MKPSAHPYTSTVLDLLAIDSPFQLVPKQPVSGVQDQLSALTHAEIFGDSPIADPLMADACRSGLWLRFDFLDRSHTISQDLATPTGSFWHAIMHRREPDWSNANYWFRQVGEHAIFGELRTAMRRIAGRFKFDVKVESLVSAETWDPYTFVDLCEQATRDGGELAAFCREVQLAEWELLFAWCYQRAISPTA